MRPFLIATPLPRRPLARRVWTAVTCIDRYILRVYLRTLVVCFVSFAGVFVVFHAFTNMDELADYAERTGGMAAAMARYYGPFMLMLFEVNGTVIALLALLFTLGLLRRTGELTALLAAGISHGRIVRPMLVAAAAVIALAALNRELLLPRWQDELGMKAKELSGDSTQPLLPCEDRMAGILIKGKGLVVVRHEIVAPAFKLYASLPRFGQQLNAQVARWVEASAGQPSGYLLSGVSSPEDIDSIPSQHVDNTVLLTSRDTPWLERGQCFVVSQAAYDFLRSGSSWKRMATTGDLIRRVSNPAVYCAPDVHVTLHDRWLRPPLDFSLIVLSLSLVVGRAERNLFVVAGYATALVGLFFGMRTLFHMMGGSEYLLDPAAAAWAPLVVLGPLAYVRYRAVQVS